MFSFLFFFPFCCRGGWTEDWFRKENPLHSLRLTAGRSPNWPLKLEPREPSLPIAGPGSFHGIVWRGNDVDLFSSFLASIMKVRSALARAAGGTIFTGGTIRILTHGRIAGDFPFPLHVRKPLVANRVKPSRRQRSSASASKPPRSRRSPSSESRTSGRRLKVVGRRQEERSPSNLPIQGRSLAS